MQKYQGQELRTHGDLFQDLVDCREDKGFHNGIAGLVGVKVELYPGDLRHGIGFPECSSSIWMAKVHHFFFDLRQFIPGTPR